MKKHLLTCVAAIVLAAPAHAQLYLAWNACDGTTGSSTANKDFDCMPNSGFMAELWGTYGLPSSTPNVIAIDGIIDFAFQGVSDVPTFWHFEETGCNFTGIVYSATRGTLAGLCASTNSAVLCGPTGPACIAGITGFVTGSQAPQLGGANRARLFVTNARVFEPVTLPGMPSRVFAFHITLLTDNVLGSGLECAGCETPTAIAWNQAIVYNNQAAPGGTEGIAAMIDSSVPGSTGTIAANGATISVGTKKRSWGQLKSLYR